jgi:large subunit ribosomal protein L25
MDSSIKAITRTESGSRNCNTLRAEGSIPAIIYGGKVESQSLSLNAREFGEYLAKVGKQEAVLSVDGKDQAVKIVDVQRHPISRSILHIDFLRV